MRRESDSDRVAGCDVEMGTKKATKLMNYRARAIRGDTRNKSGSWI